MPVFSGNKMEDAYATRIEVLYQQLRQLIEDIKVLIGGEENIEKYVPEQECMTKISFLTSSIQTFSREFHLYIANSNKTSNEKITSYTKCQLEGEQLKAELEVLLKLNIEKQRDFSNIKLPKLSLPSYNGNLLGFTEFWDKFESNIHQRQIPDADKLSYLLGCLEGDALKAVQGLSVTNANYSIAVNTLKNRFGKKDIIIDAHYSALYTLRQASYTAESCRSTLDILERHLRVLESMEESVDSNNLRAVITNKFPEQVIYQLNMIMETNNIREIRKGLDKIITAMEKAKCVPSTSTTGDKLIAAAEALHIDAVKLKSHRRSDKYKKVTTKQGKGPRYLTKRKSEYQPSDPPVQKKPKMKCIFCEGNHFNDKCEEFKNIKVRREKLRDRCLSCFKKGHWVKNCHKKKTCYYCKGQHNRALCPKIDSTPSITSNEAVTQPKGIERSYVCDKEMTKINSCVSTVTYLQTATATILNKTKEIKCRMLLDSGSQRSYITTKLMTRLQFEPDQEDRLLIFTFGSEKPTETVSPSTKITLLTKRNVTKEIRVNVVPYITKEIPVQKFPQNVDVDIVADDTTASEEVDILIGNDYYFSFIRTRSINIQENLYLVDSDFGWILSGAPDNKENYSLLINTFTQCHDLDLPYFTEPDLPLRNTDVKFLWALDSIGITDSPNTSRDEEAVKHFNETVKYEGNRYQVKWPWISFPPDLPTNYGLAKGRLVGLFRRHDDATILEYDTILKEQLKAEVIEILEPQPVQIYQVTPPLHYLAHHIVRQPGKLGRIVYDASARVKDQKSLNECLFKGPSMLEDLTALLLQFRTNRIGILADVEKAFLQVGLQPEDRDVTRFLWVKNITKPVTEENLLHLRFCRVPFGVVSSPFLLTATIRYHLSKSEKELLTKVADKCYVDNLVTGTDRVEDAYQLYLDTRKAFEELSMNIREWTSNDDLFLSKVPKQQRSNVQEVTKVLGLNWNLKEDNLQLKLNENIFSENNRQSIKNKRDILSMIASVYDPCSYAAPILLPAKLFLQDLWKRKYNWDTHLTEDLKTEWETIARGLEKAKDIKINRYFRCSRDGNTTNELHCFADSSKDAYAAVCYLRVSNKKETNTSFVMAKSRVTPLENKKNLQIPRLELLGAVIGARLIKFVQNALDIPIEKQYLWTDSQIVLSWLNTDKLLAPFVANRIKEIKQNNQLQFRYISTEMNPADVATRCDLWEQKNELWLNGPSFLNEESERWPQNINQGDQRILCAVEEGLVADQPEDVTEETQVQEEAISQEEQDLQEERQENTMDIDLQEGREDNTMDINIDEIKRLQQQYFPEEVAGKETNLKRNLNLYEDIDGVLRCRGRMGYTNWTYDMKHPILIPKQSSYTEKVIKEIHEKYYHVGTAHTLSIIRQHYWIPQGRAQVQKVLRRCPQCIKHGGGPYSLPSPPDLPAERVNFSPPFTYTGVDYFGPMFVTTSSGKEKRWVCLFTCLAVRAIHLEIVMNMTAEECLMAFRRFIATRGLPRMIVSDNALQFKLTAEVMASPFCKQNNMRWKFIPALAPWHGGFYERLVAVVKHCIKRTLEKHHLNDSQLHTVIKEIESVVNTRPLTPVSADLDLVLKPSDFLTLGNCLPVVPGNNADNNTSTKGVLIEGWKRGQKIMEEFQSMFTNQYLSSLRERYKHSLKQPRVKSSRVPRVGDLVQLKGDQKNRENWKVGKIISLVKSSDGECRVAKVKVNDHEFVRSIGHLYPLEVEDIEIEDKEKERFPYQLTPLEVNLDQRRHNQVEELMDVPEENNQHEPLVVELDPNIFQDIVPEIEADDTMDDDTDVPVQSVEAVMEDEEEGISTKRRAAVKARQKIAEWTRHLAALL